MEIEYELNVADVKAYMRFLKRNCPKPKPHPLAKVILIGFGLSLFGLWFYYYRFSANPMVAQWMYVLCIGMLAGTLFIVAYLFLLVKLGGANMIRHYFLREEVRWLLARRRLKITASGFEITNEFQQAYYSWSTVWLIDSTAEHGFFFTSFNSAQVIPRHAFRDRQHFEEFIDLACRYHKDMPVCESPSDVILDALPVEQTGITLPRKP